ncbi:chorion class B protein PC10-like [Bicyclus anynana]|uniref:Chorion class B protein PC10-like n=1 Tax=Bicyclus anynana TaxID=110368 RepID=A0A6J1P333_BICAN|nr:chorion class B protein PC10-like [Bicyclus anynana]
MAVNFYLSMCICTFFAQSITAQYMGAAYPVNNPNIPFDGPKEPPCSTPFRILEPSMLSASNGRGLVVKSISPISPNGVSVTSENAYDGLLSVTGALPFLGAAALEGPLPTSGSGSVAYDCGDGVVGIQKEEASGLGPIGYRAESPVAPVPLGYTSVPFAGKKCDH